MSLEHSVQFGEFILCPVNQQLQTSEQSITLEPKVYNVLCYLMANHHRFVSLEELHQQVWAGRVVSDTAVRRTISKLRAALQDQTETPQYIQSAAKRGYRWLQPPQPLDGALAPTSEVMSVATPSVGAELADTGLSTQSQSTPRPSTTGKARLVLRWQVWLILLFMVVGGLVYHYQSTPAWQRSEPLRTVEGEKLSLATSPDRSAIVFSSNSMNHLGQELYWYHRATGVTRQLTSGDHLIMEAVYHHDGRSLFYHDFQQGLYQLYQRPISAEGEWLGPPKALLPPQPVMSQMAIIPEQEKLLISMGQIDSMQIQQLDLVTGQLEPVTHAVTGKTQDHLFALSDDGTTLAFMRSIPGQPQLLNIMERESGKIQYQMIHTTTVFRLVFVDDKRLLILDNDALHLLHWPAGKLEVLDSNRSEHDNAGWGLSRFLVRVADNEWLQSRIVGDVGSILHQQGPVGELANRTMLSGGSHTRAMYFTQEPDQFLVVEKNNELSRLLIQSSHGRSRTLLEVPDTQLSVQALHPDGQQVLLFLNGRPQLFDIPEGKLSALQVSSKPWQQAMFDATGEAVILSVVENGIPISWRYQLDTEQSTLFHQGERVVAVQTTDDYIVLRPDHYFVRIRDGKQETLPAQTAEQFVGSIHIRQNQLFWGETDLKRTWIYRYDLESGELQQWQADRRQMMQRFDISPDGQHWLLRHIARLDTKIYPVKSRL